MTLFDLIPENNELKLIDVRDGKEYNIETLPFIHPAGKKKELAFLYIDNSIESVSMYLSFMKTHHCLALLSPTIQNHFKNELEQIYKPAFIYDTTRSAVGNYERVCENSVNYFTAMFTQERGINEKIKILLSTSGTTGSPKFVKLSDENLISNAKSIVHYLPVTSQDITPLNLPIYYSYGLSILNTNLIRGGKIVCGNSDVLKKEFWSNLEKFGYTSIAGVPYIYEMLDRIGFTKKNYPSLRYMTQAGGKLQIPAVKKYFEYCARNNIKFYVMYGQTEATARMSYLPPERLPEKAGSIGVPIENGKFEIDPESGELYYYGPNVFGGYVNLPDDLDSYQQPEFLKTGDIAEKDEDGFYYITGRLKRFVKLFGNRINLDEIESLISKEKFINTKCIGINDKELVIFLHDNFGEADNLKTFISEELKLHISVIKISKLADIPLTPNGKTDYSKLTTMYGSN